MPTNIMSFMKICLMFHLSKYVYHLSVISNKNFKMSDPYFQRISGLNKKILGISDILTFLLDITEKW